MQLCTNVVKWSFGIIFINKKCIWMNICLGKYMLYHLLQTSLGKDITLHVAASNPALLLYQAFGFKGPSSIILNLYLALSFIKALLHYQAYRFKNSTGSLLFLSISQPSPSPLSGIWIQGNSQCWIRILVVSYSLYFISFFTSFCFYTRLYFFIIYYVFIYPTSFLIILFFWFLFKFSQK